MPTMERFDTDSQHDGMVSSEAPSLVNDGISLASEEIEEVLTVQGEISRWPTAEEASEVTFKGIPLDATHIADAAAEKQDLWVDVEDKSGKVFSWRQTPTSKYRGFVAEATSDSAKVLSWHQTPTSKYREPLPYPRSIGSIAHELAKPASPNPDVEISKIIQQSWDENYSFHRQITPGNQGQVDIYTHLPTSTPTIVKTIKTSRAIPLEALILQDYIRPHPNLVALRAIFYDPSVQTCRIVMEYCSGGDLFDFADHWLYGRNEAVPEIFMLHFLASLGEALGWLHLGKRFAWPSAKEGEESFAMPAVITDSSAPPVLHRDIKLENIFLRWTTANLATGLPEIVLGDFGGAVPEQSCTDCFGTSGYFPPEVLSYMAQESLDRAEGRTLPRQNLGKVMTKASDIFSFGATAAYLLLWGDYVPGVDLGPAFGRSGIGNWPLLLALLRGCLEEDPGCRPPTESLFNLAPILRLHVRGAMACGVRMWSWPVAHARNEAKNDASAGEASWLGVAESPPLLSSGSLKRRYASFAGSSIYDEDAEDALPWGDDELAPTPTITTPAQRDLFRPLPLAMPSPTAYLPPPSELKGLPEEPRRQSVTKKLSTALRTSALYELVEGMARDLLLNVRARRSRALSVLRGPSQSHRKAAEERRQEGQRSEDRFEGDSTLA